MSLCMPPARLPYVPLSQLLALLRCCQIICVAMMLSGSLLFAYLVGSFCGLAANLSPEIINFRQVATSPERS